MIQRRQSLRFALEPRQPLRILGQSLRQHLDRNLPAEVVVGGAIHLAHAPDTKLGADGVRAKTDARCQRHVERQLSVISMHDQSRGRDIIPALEESVAKTKKKSKGTS